jgi:hypothetical protein
MQFRATQPWRVAWPKGWSALLVLFLAAPAMAREQVTIQKSASNPQLRGADATLIQSTPNTNSSGQPTITAGTLAAGNEHALILFDLSTLPNVGIKQAQLTLHVLTPPAATRTYGAYGITSFFWEPNVTWNTRVATTAWGVAGGDIPGTATGTASVTHTSTTAVFSVTADVQNWYNATPNYGWLIKDQTENNSGRFTVFASPEAALPANAPQLQINFVQNVSNLSATPGNNTITLNWVNPTPLSGSTVLEPYAGVMILRYATLPVHKSDVPTDGTTYAVCHQFAQSTVVFVSSSATTNSWTDNSTCPAFMDDPGGPPQNGITYYYKVFVFDSAHNYSCQPIANGTVFTEEISATPGATAAAQQNSVWVNATFATDLAAPSLFPGSVIMVASQTNLIFGLDPAFGLRKYPPVSIGGPIFSRSPIIDSGDSSLAKNVIYVADSDGLVYAIATDTGQILWVVNPTGAGTNDFQGGLSVQLKSLSGGTYTLTNDLAVAGTRNGATITGNEIVGLDGNAGTTLWQTVGNAGGVQPMDIMDSTPLIDYVNNAIWVTSHANCGTTQPSLWKLNPNTGAVLLNEDLGDTDASPVLSFLSDVLFVATNGNHLVGATCTAGNGVLYAINPTTGATLATFSPADGAIVDYPVVLGSSSPYTVILSGATAVHAVTFTKATNTFATAWPSPVTITVPSAPICYTGLSLVFVGSNDGKIHELNLSTGADIKDEVANTGQPGFVGDPSLDITLSRIYVSTTDQRAYGFAYPF